MWLKCYLHSLQSSPLYPVEHSLKQLPLMWWQWLAFKQGPHLFKHSGPKKPISHPCKEKERIKHIVKHVSSIYKKIGIFVFNNLINVNESYFVFSFACNVNANKSLSRQVIYQKNTITLFTSGCPPSLFASTVTLPSYSVTSWGHVTVFAALLQTIFTIIS